MGKKELINSIKDFRRVAEKRFGIEKMFVFGSAARNEMKKDSDIDLLLVSRSFAGKKFFKRAIGLHAYWKLDYPVDFLCYTPEEFERLSKKVSIVSEVLKEGIEVN